MDSYGPLCTLFYDLDKPQAPPVAFKYYLARAREAGGRVLEPMCGSGRFLLPLLRAGVDIEGFDASLAMLAACRRHADRQNLHPVLYHQFMEQLDLPHRFRMAFIPSGSIGLLSSDQSLQLGLVQVRRHLEPGSSLLLEIISSSDDDASDPAGERDVESRSVRVDDERTIVFRCKERSSDDPSVVYLSGRYEEMRGDEVISSETESIRLRKHSAQQILALLDAAGYVHSRVLDSDELSWLRASGCMLVQARSKD